MTMIDSEIYSNLMNHWVSLTDHTKTAQLWDMMRWKKRQEMQSIFIFIQSYANFPLAKKNLIDGLL